MSAAAFLAMASEYLEDVELGVYSSDAETHTLDRFGSGFDPVPQSGIMDDGHHLSADTRWHTVADLAICRLSHLPK